MTARSRWLLAALSAMTIAGLLALGIWQLERLEWKRALIARVELRVHAAPVPPPTPAQWPDIDAPGYEYRRLALSGRFLHEQETLVRASTVAGPGWWVMTPLLLQDGTAVLVNRGYVPPELRDPATRHRSQPEGQQTVTGLLRLSEPGGGILRSNQPLFERWYSRDVAAITTRRGLSNVAPYFVDAEGGSAATDQPQGGLTVLHFRNSHLSYALTWFAMAVLLAVASACLLRAGEACGEPTPAQ